MNGEVVGHTQAVLLLYPSPHYHTILSPLADKNKTFLVLPCFEKQAKPKDK